jgi:hypothetical protein
VAFGGASLRAILIREICESYPASYFMQELLSVWPPGSNAQENGSAFRCFQRFQHFDLSEPLKLTGMVTQGARRTISLA